MLNISDFRFIDKNRMSKCLHEYINILGFILTSYLHSFSDNDFKIERILG